MYKISIIRLRYIGLPLSIVLQKPYKVVGFDKSKIHIKEFSKKHEENFRESRLLNDALWTRTAKGRSQNLLAR